MSTLLRLGISAGAGLGAGVAGEVITWEPAGVHLSLGDLAMLVTMVVAAGLTGYLTRHGA